MDLRYVTDRILAEAPNQVLAADFFDTIEAGASIDEVRQLLDKLRPRAGRGLPIAEALAECQRQRYECPDCQWSGGGGDLAGVTVFTVFCPDCGHQMGRL